MAIIGRASKHLKKTLFLLIAVLIDLTKVVSVGMDQEIIDPRSSLLTFLPRNKKMLSNDLFNKFIFLNSRAIWNRLQ